MRFPWKKRVRIFKPPSCFEQLEPRIMLDAAVDAAMGFGQMDAVSGNHADWDLSFLYQSPVLHEASLTGEDGRFLHSDSDRDLQVIAIPHSALGVKGIYQAVHPEAHIVVYDNALEDLQSFGEKLTDLVDAYGQKIGTLVVLEHGENALLSLGTDKIDLTSIGEKRQDLASLGALFSENGQIQFFGCSLAADPSGKALVDLVSAFTGADVFASTNSTGSGEGKDWTLEYSSNPSAAPTSVIDADAMATLSIDLAPGDVSINTGYIDPVTVSSTPRTVDLSDAFVLDNKVPDEIMTLRLKANPLSSTLWQSMSIDTALAASLGLTVSAVPALEIELGNGTFEKMNQVLETLEGVLAADQGGQAQILLYAEDESDHDWASAMIAVSVGPVVVVPSGTLTVDQNSNNDIYGIYIRDIAEERLTITASVSHGSLTIQYLDDGGNVETLTGYVITLTEQLTTINNALAGLIYRPEDKYTGSDTITIAVAAQDKPDPALDQATIPLIISHVVPTINPPPDPIDVSNVGQHLIRGITVSDADIGSTNLAVTLSVSHGTLNVPASTTVTGNGTGSISINDTLNNVNTLLSGLRYSAVSGFIGTEQLTIAVDDLAVPVSGKANATLDIQVNPVDTSAPVITVLDDTIDAAQNAVTAIPGISVTDTDIGSGQLTVTLSVSHGTLTVQVPASTPGQTPTSYTNSVITFTDTLANVNTALAGLTYKSSSGYSGTDKLTITAVDQGTPTPGSDSDFIDITVVPATNVAPVITAPGSQTLAINNTLAIAGLSVADADLSGGSISVTVGASHGVLRVPASGAITGNGTNSINITDTLSRVNSALAGLTYTPETNYVGSDTITVVADDQHPAAPGSTTKTIPVVVSNEDPVLTVPSSITVSQNATSPISGLRVDDADAGSTYVNLSLSVSHGTLTANVRQWSSPTEYVIVPVSGSSISFSDRLSWVNSALSGLIYTPAEKYTGADSLTITAIDEAQPVSGSDTKTVPITVSNTDPSITAPSSVSVTGYAPKLISGVSVSDPDIGSTTLSVTLSVSHGTLNVPTSTTVIGNDTGSISISDTLSNVNTLLSGLRYTSSAGYEGADSLVISVDDRAVPTSGTASANVPIDVNAAALQPPLLTVPGAQTVTQDATTAISGISVTDADVGTTGLLTVTVSVSHGTLTVQVPASMPGETPVSYANSVITFTDTLANVNTALAGLTYKSSSSYSGADLLTITAVDQAPNPGSDSETISITVLQMPAAPNAAPEIVVPGPQTLQPNAANAIDGIYIKDEDSSASENYTVTVSVSHGTLTVQVPASPPGEEPINYSSSVITFTDTLTNINTALAGLEYRPSDKYTDTDTLTIAVVDQTKPDPGQDQATIALTMPNLTPTVTAPASLSVANLGQHLVRGITVSDADIGSTNLAVTLSVSHGTLNVPTASTVTGNNMASISISDTLNAINTILSGLRYTASAGYSGQDELTIVVDDLAVPVSGKANAAVDIQVSAIDIYPPEITVPGPQAVTENTTVPISGISVTDADVGTTGLLTVTVSVSHGTLTVQVPSSTPGQTPTSYTNSVITFTDTLANVNTALAGLTYKSSSGYSGVDVLTITAVDQAPNPGSDSDTIFITVSAPPVTAPDVTVPGPQTVTQNTVTAISGISVTDADVGTTGLLTVTVSVSHGTLTVQVPASTPGETPVSYTNSVITFTDTLANVNTALAGLTYKSSSGYSGADVLTITAVDQAPNPGSDSESVAITVTAIPASDPDIIVPGPQTVPQNATSAITGIYVSDEGASPDEKLTVTLSVSHGTLTVQVPSTPPGATPVTYSNTVITFTDTLANVNTALAGLKYTPTEKYYGSDTLTVTVVDQAQPQPGTDQETVSITIPSIAPAIAAPSSVIIVGYSQQSITGVAVSDPDIGSTKLTVTLAVNHGTLNVPTSASVTGNDTGRVTITDTLANVNQSLSALRFTPTTNYSGADALSITVSDLATPTPGESSRTVPMLISSTAAIDSPAITNPAVQTVNEDNVIALNPPVSIAYADSSRELRVTLTVTNGTLQAGWKGYLSSYFGEGTSELVMTGNLNAINYGLNGLKYVPNHNYFGPDTLSIVVSTQGATPDVPAQTNLTVNSVNDPPALTMPSVFSTRSASASLVPGVSVTDPDVGAGNLSVNVKVLHGTVEMPGFQPSANIAFTDTLNATESRVSAITYTSFPGYTGPDYLTVTVSDNGNSGAGGTLSATRTTTINVS